ncbi:hypothetical protein [uncultured Propionibacterium sp.]|uniref:hypothetical protein n=1 Tax=uncultured Propionibacterium sp. TaxID=218066 RepID=UPI00292D93C0|nr:hypothetical protein [uncultured Propionibacterium sp.]
MMKKIAALGLGIAALAMTACGVPASHSDSAPTGVNAGSASRSTQSSGASAQGSDATFGTAYTWGDGLSLEVSAPEAYTPGEYAAGTDAYSQFVVFTMRIVNNTGQTWDPALFTASLQSGNREGSRVYDSGQLPDTPTTSLLDGREAQFQMAFGVADPADLVLEISPDFTHDNVIFHS